MARSMFTQAGILMGRKRPSGANMLLSDFQMTKDRLDFFDLRGVPSHTLSAASRLNAQDRVLIARTRAP